MMITFTIIKSLFVTNNSQWYLFYYYFDDIPLVIATVTWHMFGKGTNYVVCQLFLTICDCDLWLVVRFGILTHMWDNGIIS